MEIVAEDEEEGEAEEEPIAEEEVKVKEEDFNHKDEEIIGEETEVEVDLDPSALTLDVLIVARWDIGLTSVPNHFVRTCNKIRDGMFGLLVKTQMKIC